MAALEEDQTPEAVALDNVIFDDLQTELRPIIGVTTGFEQLPTFERSGLNGA